MLIRYQGDVTFKDVRGKTNSCTYMGKMLEDGKNVQSLAVIVLDVFAYNFKRRNDINKLFFPMKDE